MMGGVKMIRCIRTEFKKCMYFPFFMLAALGFAVADIAIAASKGAVTELFILLPVLFFIAAIILFGMFIMGEYLRKIFGQVKARPMYIISETEKDKHKDE